MPIGCFLDSGGVVGWWCVVVLVVGGCGFRVFCGKMGGVCWV